MSIVVFEIFPVNSEYNISFPPSKIAKKKHFPFNADELENENKNFMFDEKIKLLKDMGFEIIKKERSEHARRLKEHKKLTNVKTK